MSEKQKWWLIIIGIFFTLLFVAIFLEYLYLRACAGGI